MENKPTNPLNILLIVVMVIAIGLVIVMHADPVQMLIGMGIGILLLALMGKNLKVRIEQSRQMAENRIAPNIQQEISQGKAFVAEVPSQVISLIKEGRKIEAVKAVREATGLQLVDAKNKVDELALRLKMGQKISGQD